MRINDRIGEAFPEDGCTGYACRIASEYHGVDIRDPLRDPEFLAAVARGDDLRSICGCERVQGGLRTGDVVVYGQGNWQHMGVVGEDGYVLHVHVGAGSRLTKLEKIKPYLISAWRPAKVLAHG